MAIVRPFKGIRPAPELAEKVAALPYDVMNTAEAREMVKGNPYSFLHVDKAEIDLDENINPYDEAVYIKAKENLYGMIENGVYVKDNEPKFYIYALTMDGRCQRGVVCTTSIDEYINGTIKKHEFTRADKEHDRINHVDYCNANTGPIFLACRDDENIKAVIDRAVLETPVYDFVADDGIRHTVYIVNDDDTKAIEEGFKNVPALYIADGHHRNASAVKVGLKRREAKPGFTGDEEFNFYLSVVFCASELKILDYNRVVKDLNGNTSEEFMEKIKAKFDVSDGKAEKPDETHTFGMYVDGKWYCLKAKGEIIPDDAVKSLDVSILQDNVLDEILGIKDPKTDKRIDFVGGIRGIKELERLVDGGEYKAAFAMYPTSVDELMKIADEGKIMPPKSTWFEPKLRSGLFVHTLD